MKPSQPSLAWLRALLCASAGSLLALLSVHAQTPGSGTGPNSGTAANPPATPTAPGTTPGGTTNGTGPTASSTESSEAITLSPFEVVSDTRGYYATNTMSGTRFNTRLEDLAASITVVTKEQMADLAMLDINDVFLYTANTEGTGTYTDFSIDRNGSVSDNVMTSPNTANRVRGIGPANLSFGNFETSQRVPIDPLITDGVEVSRGPNANVFGLGNAAGTVNQVPALANVTRRRTQLSLRGDSYDGWRVSLDTNQVIRKNVLALRLSALRQYEGFERKPSGTMTERYNAMLKFQPFRGTTLNAAYYYYQNKGNRPNTSPPRDAVSYWISRGRPTWDPITSQIHLNGTTVGTFTTDPAVPDYFNRSFTGFNRFQMFIDQNGVGYWTTGAGSPGNDPNVANQSVRLMATSPAPVRNGQPLFTTFPVVSDKSIYDWSDINYAAANRFFTKTDTALVTLDQVFINTPRHSLVGQVGWFREDSELYERNLMGRPGNAGATGFLQVDVNERLLDGSPNPFFLRPFIGQVEPLTQRTPLRWDTYRGQLAYKLDLTRESGALRWLGLHQITGYDEYKYRLQRRYSFRDTFVDPHPWIPAGTARANQGSVTGGPQASPNITRGFFRYYVGDAQGQNVDYAPTQFAYGTYPFVWGNALTGAINREPATLGQAATTDQSGGSNNTKTILKTVGGVIQSHFLDDRIVTTFGLRQDRVYTRFGATPQQLTPEGLNFNYDVIDRWAAGDWRYNSGRTTQAGVVVKPFRGQAFVDQWVNRGSGWSRWFGEALRGLSLTYNKSDSFLPAAPAQNLFQQILPNPTGTGTDYGLALNLFDGKLVLRANHYENKQLNFRGGDASVLTQRVLRLDLQTAADPFPLATQATNWVTAANPSFTSQQVQTEVARIVGISTSDQNALLNPNPPTAETEDVVAKGYEFELNYNPTTYWTMQGSFTTTEAINSNLAPTLSTWIQQRLPVWTSVVDPRTNTLWWNTNYGGSQTPAQNFASFVQAPFQVAQALNGQSRSDLSKYNARLSTNLRLSGITDNPVLRRFSVGGALRYQSRIGIGYYGRQQLPAVITELDPNRPIYDKARVYVDAFITYRTKLWSDKINTTIQLNVRNLQESGRLQPIAAYPDGTPSNYRIVDPRQFILTATFDL
jgi:hypothetical protein